MSVFAASLPGSWPLLGAILSESATEAGAFIVVAGGGLGVARALGDPPCAIAPSDVGRLNATAPPSWSYDRLCEAGMRSAAALAAAAAGSPSPPSLLFTVTRATHLLLAPPPGGPPLPAGLFATLGGVDCTTNWVAPDGSAASITTPPIAALCAAAGSLTSDCGLVQLRLAGASWALVSDAAASAAWRTNVSAPLSALLLPAAYPPLMVGQDFRRLLAASEVDAGWAGAGAGTLAAALASFAGPGQAGERAAVPAAPVNVGIRALVACDAVAYASPQACTLAAAEGLAAPRGGAICAWGVGDACRPCPAGATCPGGFSLLPLPGFWVPLSTAPPSQLTPCPAPAIERCPGWRNLTTGSGSAQIFGCGAGYIGVACAACAQRFFPSASACVPCPTTSLSGALAVMLPFVIFGGVLVALAGILTLLAVAGLELPWRVALAEVGGLAAFFVAAAQSAAAAFRVTQALAPPAVAFMFTILTALQLSGFPTPPSCTTAPPFLSTWISAGAVGATVVLGGLSLFFIVRRKRHAALAGPLPSKEGGGLLSGAPDRLLSTALGALALGYGSLVGTISSTLACAPATPMGVRAYLSLVNDGTSLSAALGDGSSPLSTVLAATAGAGVTQGDLERAANDPPFAAARRLRPALDTAIPVSVLSQDTFRVCREGAHKNAWLAAAATAAVLASYSLLMLRVAWQRRGNAAQKGGGGPPSPAAIARAALLAALMPADVRPDAAWLLPAQDILTAASSALASVAAIAQSRVSFCVTLAGAILLQLAFAAVLLRSNAYEKRAQWKSTATVALLLLPSVASLASILLFLSMQGDLTLNGPGITAVAVLPLVVALPIPVVVVWAWWRALSQEARAAPRRKLLVGAGAGAADEVVDEGGGPLAQRPPPPFSHPLWGAAEEDDSSASTVENPLHRARSHRSLSRIGGATGTAVDAPQSQPPPGSLSRRRWHRVLHADGRVSFFHAGSAESIDWDVPPGDAEDGAGVWRRVQQGTPPQCPVHWHCAATGATVAADEDLPLGALTEDCAWQWEGSCWRAVARTKGPWLSKEGGVTGGGGGGAPQSGEEPRPPPATGPWSREWGGARGAFVWRCGATGAVETDDEGLPTGAATADGWVLHRDDEGDAWWFHEATGMALWEGPWAAAEAAALQSADEGAPPHSAGGEAAAGSAAPLGEGGKGRRTPEAGGGEAAPSVEAAHLAPTSPPSPAPDDHGSPFAGAAAPFAPAAGEGAEPAPAQGGSLERAGPGAQSMASSELVALLASVQSLQRTVDAAAVAAAAARWAKGAEASASRAGNGVRAQRPDAEETGGSGGGPGEAAPAAVQKEHHVGDAGNAFMQARARWATSSLSFR